MTHVLDDLELFVLGALPGDEAGRVARHLADCPSCRTAASGVAEVVAALPEAIPQRDPPANLRSRILTAARAESAPRGVGLRLPWPLPRIGFVAMAFATLALLAVDVDRTMALRAAQAERDEYGSVVADIAHGGRSWYMAGLDQWRGSGGDLLQPATGGPAFVLFHGLRDLPSGQMYAVWLISPDDKWARAANFRSDGHEVQKVALALDAASSEWCAVTVETSPQGKHRGPMIMRSRNLTP